MLMDARILFQVGAGESEQSGSGAQVVSLQMHERAGQLNEPFEKRAVRAVLVVEPQMFQHLVGLVKKLFVETMEITEIMRVEWFIVESLNHRGDAFALAAHGFSLNRRSRGDETHSEE